MAGGFEDEEEFLAEGAIAEEEDHNEGVREADFGAVDEAVAGTFEDGEDRVEGGGHDDWVDEFLKTICQTVISL